MRLNQQSHVRVSFEQNPSVWMADVNPAFDGEFSALFQPNCCDEEMKHQWSETRERELSGCLAEGFLRP